jgi:hypothetical protein
MLQKLAGPVQSSPFFAGVAALHSAARAAGCDVLVFAVGCGALAAGPADCAYALMEAANNEQARTAIFRDFISFSSASGYCVSSDVTI